MQEKELSGSVEMELRGSVEFNCIARNELRSDHK